MDDLDALLEDLGRPKSTAIPSKKPRAPSSRVDLNELEDLMQDLASPSSAAAAPPAVVVPAPVSRPVSKIAPVPVPVSKPAPVPAQPQQLPAEDDLDSLMASLSTTTSVAASTARPAPVQPKPAAVVSKPAPAPVPVQAQAPPMDDLDALLSSLDQPSRGSAAGIKPAVATPVQAAPRPVASSPAAQPSYPLPPHVPASYQSAPSQPSYAPQPTYAAQPPQPAYNQRPPAAGKPPAKGPLAGDDLDNLLSNLTSQMSDINSAAPTSRGTCATCKKPILGETIQAMGKAFHPEHFTCGNCQNPLGTANFYEQDGMAHCERCYQELFCARCAHCDEAILDRCVTALGKKWHINHFICTQCLSPFEGGSFFEREGKPFCENCFYGAFAPRCGSCNQPIRGECINALGKQWHPEHFVCQYCQKSFAGGSFYEFAGKPYCEQHYHQQQGSLCAGCGKAITGKVINALDKKWHPEHFVCAFWYVEQNSIDVVFQGRRVASPTFECQTGVIDAALATNKSDRCIE